MYHSTHLLHHIGITAHIYYITYVLQHIYIISHIYYSLLVEKHSDELASDAPAGTHDLTFHINICLTEAIMAL